MQDITEEKRVTLERSEEGGLGISIQVSIDHIIINSNTILGDNILGDNSLILPGWSGLQMFCQGL